MENERLGGAINLQKVNAREIILNAVEITEPTWRQYGIMEG